MKRIILLPLLYLVFIAGCTNDTPTESDPLINTPTYDFNFEMTVSPNIGGLNTQFIFSFIETAGNSIDSLDYYIELDIDGDGEFDKKYYKLDSVKTDFNFIGKKIVTSRLVINNNEIVCSTEVIVVDRIRILEGDRRTYFHEPHIYNSKNITVTWGGYGTGGHRLHMLDINGSYEKCLFCEYPSINSSEMHCSQLSFDGTKIIWDTGMNLYYYDFTSGKDTAQIIFNPAYYEQGKICWSYDNSKIFVINNGSNRAEGVSYIDLNDNFSINKVTDFGNFICIVPGNNDLLAIMERTGTLSADSIELSNLKFYSLSQKMVVNEFKGIKGFNYFRIIDNGNKIFFGEPFQIYDLYTKKYYNINFNEIVFEGIGYFQSDITLMGDKITFSVFDKTAASTNVNLYMFNLPIDEM